VSPIARLGGARHRPARHPRPVASRQLVFAIVSLALFMSSIDATVVATALPTLRHSLHAPISWTSWTITAYQLGLAVAMPVAGRLSDQLGRRRVFIASAVVFTAASLLCGLSTSIGMLIALRLVQALGGGAFVPSASGIIVEVFGGHRTRALGLLSGIFPLGSLVGPIIGGVLLSDFSWRSIFFVNVPIGVVFTALAIRYLPHSSPVGGRVDFIGALQVAGALLAAMYAVTRLGSSGVGITSPSFALPALVAIACGVALVRRSHRVESPLIPLHLLRGRAFLVMNGLNFVWGACAIGLGSLIPLYAEQRYGFTPLAAGTLLTARAFGEALLAVAVTMVLRRTGYRLPMIVGFWLISAGMVLVVVAPPALGPYGWLSLGAALTGLGIGASAPSANNASFELAPDDIGAISGLRGMFRQSGAIIGITLTTSLVARSAGETESLGRAFVAMAACLAALTPLIMLTPDGRGRRRDR
jgi:EmrB/QacA subfamily drug resistance transporter